MRSSSKPKITVPKSSQVDTSGGIQFLKNFSDGGSKNNKVAKTEESLESSLDFGEDLQMEVGSEEYRELKRLVNEEGSELSTGIVLHSSVSSILEESQEDDVAAKRTGEELGPDESDFPRLNEPSLTGDPF